MMSFLIPDVLAKTATTAGNAVATHHQNSQMMLLWLVVFAVFIYFLMWRPQAKRAKQHKELMSSLKEGDEVVTSGGFVGKIFKVEDSFLVLQLAENTEVRVQKSAISSILPKGTIK